jgi:hypothetical protein
MGKLQRTCQEQTYFELPSRGHSVTRMTSKTIELTNSNQVHDGQTVTAILVMGRKAELPKPNAFTRDGSGDLAQRISANARGATS